MNKCVDVKKCGGCKLTLPLDAFARSKSNAFGRHYFCRKCLSADTAARYKGPTEEGRAKARQWYHDHKEAVREARRLYRQNNREKFSAKEKADRENQRARHKLLREVRAGRIKRPTNCSLCGKQCKPDAHHYDYFRPLAVEWLCRKCHMNIHKKPSRVEIAA